MLAQSPLERFESCLFVRALESGTLVKFARFQERLRIVQPSVWFRVEPVMATGGAAGISEDAGRHARETAWIGSAYGREPGPRLVEARHRRPGEGDVMVDGLLV